ncbi:MAG: GNAT family N-acetyltransferase, partial [Deltaproteobacteria bacterium]|nr:GNAT family N-acetyltransferase [Deltaproteobacteria bacterium]
MEKQNLKKQLTVRQLGPEDTDQFNRLLRYVFQVTNEELLRSGYEDGELVRSKQPLLERADTFGWFKGDD